MNVAKKFNAIERSCANVAEWIKARPSALKVKCPVCLDPEAREALHEILAAMVDHQVPDVSIREILERLRETHGVTFSWGGLSRHLAEHDRERWSAAKGR